KEGEIKLSRRVSAVELWRKMLTRVFETGHPWITWKDPSNIRSPQDHKGVVHSSNLCTEILLNTSPEETAVCNLGSINLKAHMRPIQKSETRFPKETGFPGAMENRVSKGNPVLTTGSERYELDLEMLEETVRTAM